MSRRPPAGGGAAFLVELKEPSSGPIKGRKTGPPPASRAVSRFAPGGEIEDIETPDPSCPSPQAEEKGLVTLHKDDALAQTTGDGGSERGDIVGNIRALIAGATTYPISARKLKMEGTVIAAFSISGAGQPEEIEVVKSSGFGVLDKEAEKIIRRASPYPPVGVRVEVPISFRLSDN